MCRMTGENRGDRTDKVDGRRTRRGTRPKYARRRIHGQDLLERYALLLMAIMEQLGIPEYRHPKSNHIYSYRQKLALLVLRKRLRLSYRQFVIDLPSHVGFLKAIGLYDLDRMPDRSTYMKFVKTVDETDLERIVCAFQAFVRKDCVIAIDGTGFSNFLRSAHFVKRCKELGIKKEPRSYTKGSFAAETKTHLILSARISAVRKHDVRFIPEHVKDLEGLSISYALMDKGYDSEPVHRFMRSRLGCITVIPCRESRRNRGFATHGSHRKQMLKRLKTEGSDEKRMYRFRPQVETTNYMVKTHTGSHIPSELEHSRIVEGLCMVIAHNCKIVVEKGLVRNEES